MYQLTYNDFFKDSNVPIATELRAPQENFPEHSHDFQELIIVSKGTGTHVINDSPNQISQNQICFVEPQDRHLFEDVNHLYLSNILFRKEALYVPDAVKDLIPKTYEKSEDKTWYINNNSMHLIETLVQSLNNELNSNEVHSKVMAQALFQQLIIELHRGRMMPIKSVTNDDKMIQVLEWLNHNYHEKFTLEEIAEKFQLGPRTLSRKIKQMTHSSFNSYMHQIRINKAIELLQYSDLSITDIAFKIGYLDSNYFSTKFKKITKRSPSDYR